MNRSISLKKLSEYRAALMGIAIICTILCHTTVTVPEKLVYFSNTLKSILQCGVDMFMLLSGLGLTYSFRKNPDKWSFWKKRYSKLLPPYAVAVFVYGFVYVGYLKRATLGYYLWAYSLVSFFAVASLCIWFIAAIFLLYALFPLLYTAMHRHYRVFLFMCFTVAAGCFGLSFFDCHKTVRIINEIFISRVPAFLTGMIIAKAVLDGRERSFSVSAAWILWFISAVLIVWVLSASPKNYWTIARLLFLPFSFSGMLILTTLLDQCRKSGFLYRSLVAAGGITLELYLIHERALATINEFLYLFHASPILLSVVANIFAILVSFVGALVLKNIVFVLSLLWNKAVSSVCISR